MKTGGTASINLCRLILIKRVSVVMVLGEPSITNINRTNQTNKKIKEVH
jgi:hypothetical protein